MYQGQTLVIENTSDADIVDMYDAVNYTFLAHETLEMRRDLAIHFASRHPEALRVIEEKHNVLREATDTDINVVSRSEETITEYWDGQAYVFERGKPLTIEKAVADQFIAKHPEALLIGTEIPEAEVKATPATGGGGTGGDAVASTVAPEPASEQPTSSVPDGLTCPTCGKEYKSKSGLKKHLTTHN